MYTISCPSLFFVNSSLSEIDREVVVIALSYFDRYASRHTAILAEPLFQLVAMTSLYLAVKLHSTRKLSVKSIVSSFQRLQVHCDTDMLSCPHLKSSPYLLSLSSPP